MEFNLEIDFGLTDHGVRINYAAHSETRTTEIISKAEIEKKIIKSNRSVQRRKEIERVVKSKQTKINFL